MDLRTSGPAQWGERRRTDRPARTPRVLRPAVLRAETETGEYLAPRDDSRAGPQAVRGSNALCARLHPPLSGHYATLQQCPVLRTVRSVERMSILLAAPLPPSCLCLNCRGLGPVSEKKWVGRLASSGRQATILPSEERRGNESPVRRNHGNFFARQREKKARQVHQMTGHSLDGVASREQAVLRGDGPGTVMAQRAHQNQQTPGDTGTKQTRMPAEDIMTFWNCMVPCGWSLGGLMACLLNRQRTPSGQTSEKTSALRAILLALLATLCYLIAVQQTVHAASNHTFEQPGAYNPGKRYSTRHADR